MLAISAEQQVPDISMDAFHRDFVELVSYIVMKAHKKETESSKKHFVIMKSD